MLIKSLHIEASTYCNARCPGCPRNAYGVNLTNLFPLQHLSVKTFKGVLQKFPNVGHINFNGNLGDPMMNPNILDIVKLTKANINITTNGSIGKLSDFIELARLGHEITFSIDGLEDTNHLYRQDVDWHKIMERVKTFIDNGGRAIWKWVIFKHNVHQIEEARKLSADLGFVNFMTEDHGRNNFPALTKDKKVSHWILPADGSAEPDPNFDVEKYIDSVLNPYNVNPQKYNCKISCEHLTGSVYVSATGSLHPCCYQGFDLPDRSSVALEDFDSIKQTWNTNDVNLICGSNCKVD